MKQKLFRTLLCLCAALTLLCVTVSADSGPKPSVQIAVRGTGGAAWYATLLADTDSTGPYYVFEKYGARTPVAFEELDADPAWHAFYHYTDADGFRFLQFTARGEGDSGFAWTYYPPQTFKVLFYFPDRDAYAVSEIAACYAFDSYFTVDLHQAADGVVPIVKSRNYGHELYGLLFRVALTVAVELLVALPFGYGEKRYLSRILFVNLVTQLLLNLALDAAARYGGMWMAALAYLPLEIAVFLCEGAFYRAHFDGKGHPYRYALAANAASFGTGILLSRYLPGLF